MALTRTTDTVHHRARLDTAALDAVLAGLLDNNPRAPIVALGELALFIPMPAAVPITGQHLIEGHSSAMELIVAGDANVAMETWTQVRRTGAARATVHLVSDHDRAVVISCVDATHRYGVFIGVFEVESNDDLMATFDDAPTLRPQGCAHPDGRYGDNPSRRRSDQRDPRVERA